MEILINLFLFLLPFERIPSWELFGITVRLNSLILVIFLLVLTPILIKRKKIVPLSNTDKSIFIYLGIVILSILFANSKTRSLQVLAFLLLVILAYLITSRLIINRQQKEKAANIIIYSGLITSLFGLFQFFADSLNLPASWTGLAVQYSKAVFGFARIQSVSLEPLYFANFLILPIWILISKILYIDKKNNAFNNLALILISAAFILTLSRGAFIAFGVSLFFAVFYAAILKQKSQNILRIFLIFCFSGLIAYSSILLVSGNNGADKFAKHAANSDSGSVVASTTPRLNNYQEAYRIFKENPFLGVGIGNYGVVNTVAPKTPEGGYMIVNNQYLETLAETGILGLITLIAIIVSSYKKWKNEIQTNTSEFWYYFPLGMSLIALLVQYNFFSTIYYILLWTILGMINTRESSQQ